MVADVVAPDGRVLESTALDRAAENGAEAMVRLSVTPAAAPVLEPAITEGPRQLVGRVVDRGGARPASNVQVVVFGRRVGDEDAAPVLATTTDANGGFVADDPGVELEGAYAAVGAGRDVETPIILEKDGHPVSAGESGQLPSSLLLAVRLPEANGRAATVPRLPDERSLVGSQGVFSSDAGTGQCVSFTVPDRTLQEVDFYSVVRTTEPILTRWSGGEVGHKESLSAAMMPYPWFFDSPGYMPNYYWAAGSIAHGHLLHFKQKWQSDGYSLGDLLYSLPLAPCQKKQIAIVDWDRREAAQRTEALEYEERLQALLTRDRDINEIVAASLSESMRAASTASTEASAWGVGGGFGVGGFGILAGAAGGSSSASSSAWQASARQTAASSLSKLQDRTQQAASAVRSQRTTVVQAVGQDEAVQVQTEVVANHNHCHAMTVEYFEVLRHLIVRQELVDVRECLFVPMAMRSLMWLDVLGHRRQLEAHLRDRSLLPAFDAIQRRHPTGLDRNSPGISDPYAGMPELRFADEHLTWLDGELRLQLTVIAPADPDSAPEADRDAWLERHYGPFGRVTRVSTSTFYERLRAREKARREQEFEQTIAPEVARRFVERLRVTLVTTEGVRYDMWQPDATLVTPYRRGRSLYVRLGFPKLQMALTRAKIDSVELSIAPEAAADLSGVTSEALVQSIRLRYRTANLDGDLVSSARVDDDLRSGDAARVPVNRLTARELRDPRKEDALLEKKLMDHLAEHYEYYNHAIWWSMDPNRRYLMLDKLVAPGADGRSVASVVENTLLGIVGNSLVMPVAPGFHLDPTYSTEPGPDGTPAPTLLEQYLGGLEPPPAMRIALPTRGVFAEAVLGSCNSCEVKDESRFWRFDESPCGDEPTPISGVSTETRARQEPDMSAKDFPAAPIITMQQAPSAADPTGLGAAMTLLGNANAFRDITGLTENQRNALEALRVAMEGAKSFGKEGAGLALESAKLAQQDKLTRTIKPTLDTIKQAQAEGLISAEQASSLTESALRGLVGDERRPAEAPPGRKQPVASLIEEAKQRDSFQISSREQGGSVDLRVPAPKEKAEPEVTVKAGQSSYAGRVNRSTSNQALAAIAAFAGRETPSPWKGLDRAAVAARLRALVDNPSKVDQAALNLCGPAAFVRVWARRDPAALVRFATALYEQGYSRIGTYEVRPDDDSLLGEDYAALKQEYGAQLPSEADWMILGALRDAENFYFDYEGRPEEDVSAITTPGEVVKWLEAAGAHKRVRDETNMFFNKRVNHALALDPDSADVVMLVNSSMLPGGMTPLLLSFTPNHFITLESRLGSTSQITGDYWSWGQLATLAVDPETFEDNYYGAIVAEL